MKSLFPFLALFGMCFAYSAYSNNYTIGSYHQGMIEANSSRFRSTTTYQQGGNPYGNSLNYLFNLGWLKKFLFTIPAPVINIQSPVYTNYTNNTIDLNYTVSGEHIVACWYKLDGGNATPLTNCSNASLTIPDGIHSLTIYANNTAGNTGQATVNFIIQTHGNISENGLKKMLNDISNGVSMIIGSPLLLAIFLGWTVMSGLKADGKMFVTVLLVTLIVSMLPIWFIDIMAILAGMGLLIALGKWMGYV